jgi:hypothetical protein
LWRGRNQKFFIKQKSSEANAPFGAFFSVKSPLSLIIQGFHVNTPTNSKEVEMSSRIRDVYPPHSPGGEEELPKNHWEHMSPISLNFSRR